jgi:hypothetical protein
MDLNIINKDFSIVEKNVFFSEYTKAIKGFRVFEEDTTQYFSNKIKGIEFVFNREKLTSIHFYGEGKKEYNRYEGDFPYDINILDNKSNVYEKFGKYEIKKGGGEVLPILGKSNEWSMFKIQEYNIRFEFSDNKIVLITFSKANESPR